MSALITLAAAPTAIASDQPVPESTLQPASAPPAQVLVHWRDGVASTQAAIADRTNRLQDAAGGGLQYVRRMATGADVYRLPAGADEATFIARLMATPGVASVEPDIWMTPTANPTNDTDAASMWGLLGPDQGSQYGIDAVDAWPSTTGAGVIVAVIDTGLVSDHPDLAGQSVPGYDLISYYGQGGDPDVAGDGDGRDPDAGDPGDWTRTIDSCPTSASSWHGTHVAGTIAALAGNGLGVFGGAPGVKVQPVRVLGHCGGYMSDVIDGIYWAAGYDHVCADTGVACDPVTGPFLPVNTDAVCNGTDPCVRVLNLSLGGQALSCDPDLEAAIQFALDQDKVVVAAAGNGAENARYFSPANCPGVFTVAATNASGMRASFSNYGSRDYPVVDIAAPGVGVLSTVNSSGSKPTSNYTDTICYGVRQGDGCSYDYYEGTSMATPHVSLTAALVAAENPTLTAPEIEDILRSTAQAFPYSGAKHSCSRDAQPCGAGIVNAAAAVAAAAPPPTPPGVPTSVAAAAGAGAIAISWQPPVSDGGSEIIGYEADVTSADDGSDVATCATAGTLSCTVSGLADGSYMVTVRAQNGVDYGDPSDQVGPITVPAVSPADTQPPAVLAPVVSIGADQSAAGAITLAVSWPAATDDNGVQQYLLQARIDGGRWSTISLPAPDSTSATLPINPGSRVELRLAASDTAGNWSDWAFATSSPMTMYLVQERPTAQVVYKGYWRKHRLAGASSGRVRATGHPRRTVTFTFSGTSVAWVSTLGPRRGIATVRVDDGAPQTVDLYSADGQRAHVVWSSAGLTDGPHTLVVTVTGTRNPDSLRRRVDVDAFLTL